MDIEDLNDGIYLFRFHHEHDLHRIMTEGPWNYDGSLLLLHELKAGENPRTVPLHLIPFWIQVHDLPFDYFSEVVDHQYMRIQVELDVRHPLKRTKKVRLHRDISALCKFRYERLQSFCFICGILGHTDKYCEAHFHFPAD
ncbi:hypothetical protein LINGRAHAP2_LOCUS20283 [Linum grandiflorum]